jgi:hypothetical protein
MFDLHILFWKLPLSWLGYVIFHIFSLVQATFSPPSLLCSWVTGLHQLAPKPSSSEISRTHDTLAGGVILLMSQNITVLIGVIAPVGLAGKSKVNGGSSCTSDTDSKHPGWNKILQVSFQPHGFSIFRLCLCFSVLASVRDLPVEIWSLLISVNDEKAYLLPLAAMLSRCDPHVLSVI